jgi:Domain of unknown function (DUF4145)
MMAHDSRVDSVYHQTITAFNNKLPTLAGAGIRLLIEGICLENKISSGKVYTDDGKLLRHHETGKTRIKETLEGKTNGLRDKGYISKKQAKLLHQLRKLGNEATHALDEPPLALIAESITAIEHLMAQVYEQPELLKRLKNRKKPEK